MPLDKTPGEIVVKTRDQIRDDYLRDYRLRSPDADTGPDTQPYVDASAHADSQILLYNDAQVIGRGTSLRTSRGSWLKVIGEAEVGPKREPVGASGYVEISASAGGGTIFANDELVQEGSNLKFVCQVTAVYLDEDPVPIVGVDTGPGTNLAAGSVLTWSSPRPGIGPLATVIAQSDGSGLSGGRDEETDEQYALRIEDRRENPPASGNTAAYVKAVQDVGGLGIEKCFPYPAIVGPGSTGIVFTMRPAKSGASRLPNGTHIAKVRATLEATFPNDDSIFVGNIASQQTSIVLRVTWKKGAASWTDPAPWPPYNASPVAVLVGPTPTPTTFRLHSVPSTTTPKAGQTIGVYDTAKSLFRRKKILSVTVILANHTWDIVCDTANAASDTSYTPVDDQLVSPWSDSLDALSVPVLAHFDGLGPGEQVASLVDPGRRQRRQPESPAEWPSEITNRLIAPVQALPAVGDASLVAPTVPWPTTVGTPGVLSYLQELQEIAAYP